MKARRREFFRVVFLLLFRPLATSAAFLEFLSAAATTHDSLHEHEEPVSIFRWRYRADLMLE